MNSKKEKNSDEQFYSLLSSLKRKTIAPDSKFLNELKERSVKEFQDSASRGSASSQESTNIIFRRIIMKNRFTKLAVAAAVIIIVFFVGLPFVGEKHHGVALADVLAKVEQARAFMYKIKITRMGDMKPDMPAQQEITAIVSTKYGIKWEMDAIDPNTGKKMTDLLYVLPDQKMVVGLMPKMKQYMRRELDDDWLARMKKQNNDPREVIKQIMNCKYTELGRSVIDGIEVEGFQTTDPTYFGGAMEKKFFTLWVDAENWLPVRSELKNEQTQASEVTYDYRWNVPVYADEFEPMIPEDFTAFPTDGVKLPGMSEEAAIEGLRLFAEIAGRYPKKLNMTDLAQEIAESFLKGSDYIFEELRKLKEEMSQNGEPTKEEFRNAAIKRTTSLTQPLQSPGHFYTMLVKDKKEPAYYGESVGPENAAAVLLRWRISDNQYRVIFGDLKTADVSAEQLAELEALQPK